MKNFYKFEEVTWFSGCLPCLDIVESYHPERVVRQMGRVQGIPKDVIKPTIRKSKACGTSHDHCLLTDWKSHVLHDDHRGDPIQYRYGTRPDYYPWFMDISHRIVQPRERVKTMSLGDTTIREMNKVMVWTCRLPKTYNISCVY